MPQDQEKRSITVVSAYRTAAGTPAFALNTVEVTQKEIENGIHFYLVEGQLLEEGRQEPFVHFDEEESPAFLIPSVRQHLGLFPVTDSPISLCSEEPACPASSR